MEENKIVLNGKTLTEQQFEIKKEEVKKEKGVDIVEVAKDVYKTRLND